MTWTWRERLRHREKLLGKARRQFRYWEARWKLARKQGLSRKERGRRWRMREARRKLVRHRERLVAEARSKVGAYKLSDRGAEFIASWEGFSARPYRDPVGVWTIGYGSTKGVGPNTPPVTREQALARLKREVDEVYGTAVARAARAVGLTLKQGEFDALTSLVYNCGPGTLDRGRTMGEALRSKDRRRIADAFLVYDKAGGVRLAGLTRRRRAERAMFLAA